MGLSPSNLSGSNIFRSISTPIADTAAISRGAFRTPSATALAPSNTAAATNANPATGGPTFISSAQVLAQNAITTSNVVTSQNAIETGQNLKQALSAISEQTPAPRFQTKTGVFQTPQTQQTTTAKEFNPINVFSNVRTSSPAVESGMAMTGRNAAITAQSASDFAAVNANLGVKFTQQGSQALLALQNAATLAAMQGAAQNITGKMDGMIPVTAALTNDFSLINHAGTRGSRDLKIFDNVTETFNKLLDGGGHGGGTGGLLGRPEKEEENAENQNKKKGFNMMG
jgi:hypothetical protein